MFTLPYQTTVCKIYNKLDAIQSKIRVAALDEPLETVFTPNNHNIVKNAYFVTPKEEHDDVPNFTQFLKNEKGELIIDARQYMRYDVRTASYKVTAGNDWNLQCIRLALTNKLIDEGPLFLSRLSDVPVKVFTRWVAGALINRYDLPIDIQLNVYVIACCYYYAMIDPELREPSPLRLKYVPLVSTITGVAVNRVYDLMDTLGSFNNANDLAQALAHDSGQIRTGDLKFADLFTLLSMSWFGVNARENIGVALEHPPTFIGILYSAIAERSFRKTVITQRAESAIRPNDLRIFTDLVEKSVMSQFSNTQD